MFTQPNFRGLDNYREEKSKFSKLQRLTNLGSEQQWTHSMALKMRTIPVFSKDSQRAAAFSVANFTLRSSHVAKHLQM